MAKEKIGFVGVGLMGHGMAKNIVEKGHPLTILGHKNRAPVEDLLKRGAVEARSARELAEKSEVIFLCVTGAAEVEALVRGKEGVAAGAKKLELNARKYPAAKARGRATKYDRL